MAIWERFMRTSTTEPKSDVIYRSGTSVGLGAGWDVMQVLYRVEDGGQMRLANSFAIARDSSGKIIRKIDSYPEQWEVIDDAEELRGFRECFDERDRLQARVPPFSAKCPACDKSVTAFLVMGSLENLVKGEGEVKLAHCTNDPYEGDHTWILNDPQAKARLRRLVTDKEQGL
jgi:hypothetical protein